MNKFFDPFNSPLKGDPRPNLVKERFNTAGDRRDGAIYLFDPDIVLAVNVAIATSRPLLVRGHPGCGKSSLAASVARHLGWNYFEQVVTARTQAEELLWRVDLVRRLSDAQTKQGVHSLFNAYLEPGILWWAFDAESAEKRGLPELGKSGIPPAVMRGINRHEARTVVLLDEIDKADPDVPNNLLVPLGSYQFNVDPLDYEVAIDPLKAPLVVITSNEERDLPAPFVRRCIVVKIKSPNEDRLVEIANAHFGKEHEVLYREIAKLLPKDLTGQFEKRPASTAEYLDAVRACLLLDFSPASPQWQYVKSLTLLKPTMGPDSE